MRRMQNTPTSLTLQLIQNRIYIKIFSVPKRQFGNIISQLPYVTLDTKTSAVNKIKEVEIHSFTSKGSEKISRRSMKIL